MRSTDLSDHVGTGNGSGSMGLKFSGYLRGLMTSAALAAVVALAGCETDGLQSGKAMKRSRPRCAPSSRRRTCRASRRSWCGCSSRKPSSKSGSRTRAGRYELLKTYPICRWSGELGPKIKEGDRQAPEGFYTITPAQMNPNSQFYLSFNMGYPNAFDKAHGRTGAHLMVHGDCSSRGCYAMTDDQIGEIYALARESLLRRPALVPGAGLSVPHDAGELRQASQQSEHPVLADAQGRQRPLRDHAPGAEGRRLREALRVQRRAPPQNVTPANGIKLGTPWGGFQRRSTQQASLKFNPVGKCPAYEVPADVLAEVKAKQRQDDQQIASLSSRVDRGADPHRPRRRHASDVPRQAQAAGSARARRHGALRGRRERREDARLLRQSAARNLSGEPRRPRPQSRARRPRARRSPSRSRRARPQRPTLRSAAAEARSAPPPRARDPSPAACSPACSRRARPTARSDSVSGGSSTSVGRLFG